MTKRATFCILTGPVSTHFTRFFIAHSQHRTTAPLNSIQFNLGRVIGPFIAGAALAAFGMVSCFGLNSISFLFVVAAILALRDVHVPRMATESIVAQFNGGLRFVQGSPKFGHRISGFFGQFLGEPLLTFLPSSPEMCFTRTLASIDSHDGVGCGRDHRGAHRCVASQEQTDGTHTTDIVHAVRHDHCRLRAVAEAFLSAFILFTGGSLLVMCSSLTTSLAQLLAPRRSADECSLFICSRSWAAHRSAVLRADCWSHESAQRH